MLSEQNWLSIPKGMDRSGLTRSKILAHGIMGDIEVTVVDGRVFVSAESLDAFCRRDGESKEHRLGEAVAVAS